MAISFLNLSHAALSTATANTIQGTKPFIKLDGTMISSIDELLSFDIPDGSSGSITIDPTVTTVINADPNWSFNQFEAKVMADGISKDLSTLGNIAYDDLDGDIPAAIPIIGTLTATWSYDIPDGMGGTTTKTLSNSDLAGKFDACNSPYILNISANNIQSQSLYGEPAINNYGTKSHRYEVKVTDYKFCFAKPNSMIVTPSSQWLDADGTWDWNSGNPNRTTTYGGGYTNDFDPVRGFKASAITKFPTTGFPGAQFQLVMSNDQSDYTFSVTANPSGSVSVDSQGNVKLITKPTGIVTVSAVSTITGALAGNYVFDPTSVWAIPKSGTFRWDTNDASNQCGGISNVLTRAELTNTPYIAAPSGWLAVTNYYTRAIGGGIFNEWGWTDNIRYPDSYWIANNYWTQEINIAGSTQFFVHSHHGLVSYTLISDSNYVACRG